MQHSSRRGDHITLLGHTPQRHGRKIQSGPHLTQNNWSLIARLSQLEVKAGYLFSFPSTAFFCSTQQLTMEMNSTACDETPILGAKAIFQNATPSLVLLVIVPIVTFWLWTITSYVSSPLKKYPGPFLASK